MNLPPYRGLTKCTRKTTTNKLIVLEFSFIWLFVTKDHSIGRREKLAQH